MSQQIRCEICGAPMKPHADGRRYTCEHCDSERQVAIDSEQLAQGLKLDLSNVEAFLRDLAASLLKAFPGKTRVLHEGSQLVVLEINLDPHMYIAKRDMGGNYTAQYKKLVRGVALKTKILSVDVWVQQLTQSIADHANQNAHVAQVLAQLKGSI
jgi:hypothetical protein